MRVVVQRVKEASVSVDGEVTGKIGKGLLVLFGVKNSDKPEDTVWLLNKLVNLRIFADEQGKMNLSVKDVQGEILVVSQFTLYGNCKNGRRPDFFESAPPVFAEQVYEKFLAEVEKEMGSVQAGRFGAMMQVQLINDGPVTLIIDSP
jgi:D-tyrosyl-tRNA(Tyr) deacylase